MELQYGDGAGEGQGGRSRERAEERERECGNQGWMGGMGAASDDALLRAAAAAAAAASGNLRRRLTSGPAVLFLDVAQAPQASTAAVLGTGLEHKKYRCSDLDQSRNRTSKHEKIALAR